MTVGLATAGILISGAALAISALSALFARRQLRLTERSRTRDFEATVVAELTRVHAYEERIEYELQITNAGPAVARDVYIALVKWDAAGGLGQALDEAQVAPALLRGERRNVSLTLRDRALANDRASS